MIVEPPPAVESPVSLPKNTLVGDEYSYVRKIRELIYSIKMTNEWSKVDRVEVCLQKADPERIFGRGVRK